MARRRAATCPTVHCVGESHACFFSGLHGLHACWPEPVVWALPGVRSYRLGHFLAHSLTRPRHAARAMLAKVLREIPRGEWVMLCFGEIDCRNHVIKQAHSRGVAIEDVARDLAERYAGAARALTGSRPLAFWAAVPTNDARVANPEYPTVGSFAERRRATEAFNGALAAAASAMGCVCLDITRAITTRGGKPRGEFFCDDVHLSPAALPIAVRAMIEAGLVREAESARELAAAARALAMVSVPKAAPVVVVQNLSRPPAHVLRYAQIKAALIKHAAQLCRERGYLRVALYGGGRHTREMGLGPFERAGVRVVKILDDAPKGEKLLGVPLVQTASAGADFDAVVISSDLHEDAMTDLARAVFEPRGVAVVRIYG